jgi:hypothetical protein
VNVSTYVKTVLFIIVVSVLAAAAAPQDRSTVIRVALFALVITAAVALVDFAQRRSPLPDLSPFEQRPLAPVAPGLPNDVERFAVEVRAFAVAVDAGPAPVPPSLRRAMEAIAASRVGPRGVRLDDPADAAACADACGPELSDALAGRPVSAGADDLVRRLGQL